MRKHVHYGTGASYCCAVHRVSLQHIGILASIGSQQYQIHNMNVCNTYLQSCECVCARILLRGLCTIWRAPYCCVVHRLRLQHIGILASIGRQQYQIHDTNVRVQCMHSSKYANACVLMRGLCTMSASYCCVVHRVRLQHIGILASIGRGRVDWTLPEANYIQPNTQIIPPPHSPLPQSPDNMVGT